MKKIQIGIMGSAADLNYDVETEKFAKELGMTTVRIYYNANSAKDKTYIDEAYKGINSFLEEYLPKASAQ